MRTERIHAEYEPPHPVFEDISDARWARLKTAVAQANGKAIILIHPTCPTIHADGKPAEAPDPKYAAILARLVASAKAPIIILEQHHGVERTAEIPGVHLVIPTVTGGPATRHAGLTADTIRYDHNLNVLTRKLYDAGVTTLLMGGMYAVKANDAFHSEALARLESRWLAGRRDVGTAIGDGCLCHAYGALSTSGAFKVRLLPNLLHGLVEPVKPDYARRPHR